MSTIHCEVNKTICKYEKNFVNNMGEEVLLYSMYNDNNVL